MRDKMTVLAIVVLAGYGAGMAFAQGNEVNVTITYVSTGKTYQVGTANPGEKFYTDRPTTDPGWGYRFLPDSKTATPALETTAPALLGMKFIRTSNDDKAVTAARYLEFTIDKPCTVYIVYDNRDTNITDWLEDGTWTKTDMTMSWTNSNATPAMDGSSPMPIYAKDFEAGTVTLGGNKVGSVGANVNTNYFVVLVPKDPAYNPAPVADANPAFSKTYVGQAVQLDGTISDEPPQEGDPGVLSWYWKKEAGPGNAIFAPSATAEDPTVMFDAKGLYTLLLQATDGTKDANDVIHVWVADRADERLVGYWDMDNNLEDKSINNNNGTLYFNKLVSAENRFVADSAIGAASIDLNTTDPAAYFVYLGAAPELNFSTGGAGDFTVAAWVKTTGASQMNVFSKGGDTTNGIRYVLAVRESTSGWVDLVTDDNVTKVEAIGPTVFNDGKWHFIVGQRSGDETRVYVDGVLDDTSPLPSVFYDLSGTSQQGAYIGIGINQQISDNPVIANTEPNNVNAKRFLGQIDDVRVYNYALALEDPGYTSIRSLAAMGPLPPTVNAGPDGSFQIRPGASYQLAGSVIDYGKEDGKTILWTTVDGPGGAEASLANPSSPTSTVTFPTAGVYTLKLTVVDDSGTTEDTVVITATTPTCADAMAAGLKLATDLNGDCYVNLQDLALMLQSWTKCNDPEIEGCIWPF